jgi:glycosyltransferase involved in cell wall biosynthesis
LTRIGFVHVAEPVFHAGGSEIRTRFLFRAVQRSLPEVSLRVIPGTRHAPWAFGRLRAAAHGVPLRLSRLDDPDTEAAVREAADACGLTVASSTFTASLVDAARLERVVLDAHNIEWRVNRQLAARSDGIIRRVAYGATTRWMKRFETKLAKSVAGVWAVSENEAEWFAEVGARVWMVPNGVELPPLAEAAPDTHRILFVGSLNSVFNREGLEWFFSHVWPEVTARVPDARLQIAGGGPSLDLPDGVEQLGFVEDLEPLYKQTQVCVAPLLSGAGTRLKVLEAMARARPVVATSVGAAGLAVSEADGVLLRDADNHFARACCELLLEPTAAVDLGQRARARALDYSWERIGSVAAKSLVDLSRP